MNKFALGAAIAALSVALPTAAPAQKIAPAVVVIVDVQKIFADCTACKAAQTQLQAQAAAIQTRAQQLGAPLQTEAQAIETAAKGKTSADAALQARVRTLQSRQSSANQELEGRQQAFQRNRAYVAQQINARLNPIITQVMQQRGATLAVDTAATLAVSPSIDVTNDVLTALNAALPSVNVNAPAAPAPAQPAGR